MNYPIQLEIPVAWGEMDAFGHVNNVVYFRYFESVRIHYFRALTEGSTDKPEFVPILASTTCDYLRPVYFPDTIKAEARVTKVGRSSVTMAYRLSSASQKVLVAQGTAVVVNIDPETGQSRPLTDTVRKRIAAIEGDPES